MKKLFITLLSLSIVSTALQASVLWTGAAGGSITTAGSYTPAYNPVNVSNTDKIGYYTGFLADGTTPVTTFPQHDGLGMAATWVGVQLIVTGGKIDIIDNPGNVVGAGQVTWKLQGGVFGYPDTSIVTDNIFSVGATNSVLSVEGGSFLNFCEFRLQGTVNISSGNLSTQKSTGVFHVYTPGAQVNMSGGLLNVPAYTMSISNTGTAKTVMTGGSLTAGTFILGNSNTARNSILEFGLGVSAVTATNATVPANTFVTNGTSNYIDFVNTTYSFDAVNGWEVTAGSGGVLTIYGWAETDYQTKLWTTKNLYINGIEASTQPGWYFSEFFTVVDAGGTHPAGTYSLKLNVVPEPASLALMGLGLGVVALLRRKKL